LQLFVFVGLAYYYFLLLGGTHQPQRAKKTQAKRSFAIIIPAHNEEATLEKTLATLAQQVYPKDQWNVYVIADHCEDSTAVVARQNGVICYERITGPRGRKAYPLAWGIRKVLESAREYDAFLVLDADSQLSSDFLAVMNDALGEKYGVLQGRHVIHNPEDSGFTSLAAVDMRLNNYLRNRAKHNLGLSARLMGDAMVFTREVLEKYGWPTESLGEDREYGLFLVEQGLRIHYVPDAISRGQAAMRWGDAAKQRLRWYGGVFEIRRNFSWRLLKAALSNRNLSALDLAIELLLPSFSTLALLSIATLGLHLLLLWIGSPSLLPLWVSIAIIGLWVAFPFLALMGEGAPTSAYRALVYAPAYLAWRIWIGLKVWLKRGRVEWVRTKRREETL